MDEFDRILSSEAQLEPAPDLARRVLDEVRREAHAPPALAFPWRRVAAATALLCIANTALAALPAFRAPAQELLAALRAIDASVAGLLLGTLAIVLATLWAAWRAD
jgi:hypothetical protein